MVPITLTSLPGLVAGSFTVMENCRGPGKSKRILEGVGVRNREPWIAFGFGLRLVSFLFLRDSIASCVCFWSRAIMSRYVCLAGIQGPGQTGCLRTVSCSCHVYFPWEGMTDTRGEAGV